MNSVQVNLDIPFISQRLFQQHRTCVSCHVQPEQARPAAAHFWTCFKTVCFSQNGFGPRTKIEARCILALMFQSLDFEPLVFTETIHFEERS